MILEYNSLPETLVLLSISLLIIIIGMLLNGFIVIINLFWWIKRQTLQAKDVLITSLGLVRLIHLFVYMELMIFIISDFYVFQIYKLEYRETVIIFIDFCSLWWGSVLSVFYGVKITNYSSRLFIRLKMNISKLAPWMLLISMVISFLSSLPYRWVLFSNRNINGTDCGKRTMEINVKLFIIIFAGSIIPFLIVCVSISLIILSLLRHTRNMSSRNSSFNDAQKDIHIGVIRCMILFLVFYTLHLVVYIYSPLVSFLRTYGFNFITVTFMCAYPSLHSISIIYCNKELRKSFLVVFSCARLGNFKQETP
ncbi:taste receptor type 2 member 39-like [Ranitomeya imitator]|uniref:taste receptor type 2 member 39-like n=1 Tax=Ranitomeya imitator TaxID=111125 RepID=UPI0037E6F7B4